MKVVNLLVKLKTQNCDIEIKFLVHRKTKREKVMTLETALCAAVTSNTFHFFKANK